MSKYDGHDDDEEKYDTLESLSGKSNDILGYEAKMPFECCGPKPTIALDDEEKSQN